MHKYHTDAQRGFMINKLHYELFILITKCKNISIEDRMQAITYIETRKFESK